MIDYDSEQSVSQYLLFHYGEHEQRMPWQMGKIGAIDFPKQTASYFTQMRVDLTLDLGCSVGASSFHLSATSKKVIGLDASEKSIAAARLIQSQGALNYTIQEEGAVSTCAVAEVPKGAKPERVSFAVADVMKLPDGFKNFDRVHAANLLCRLPEPALFLQQMPELVKEGGELVLATPFSWDERFTQRDKWPVGDSWRWMENCLKSDFELVRYSDEIFAMREHARKFQLGVSRVSLWRRKEKR